MTESSRIIASLPGPVLSIDSFCHRSREGPGWNSSILLGASWLFTLTRSFLLHFLLFFFTFFFFLSFFSLFFFLRLLCSEMSLDSSELLDDDDDDDELKEDDVLAFRFLLFFFSDGEEDDDELLTLLFLPCPFSETHVTYCGKNVRPIL